LSEIPDKIQLLQLAVNQIFIMDNMIYSNKIGVILSEKEWPMSSFSFGTKSDRVEVQKISFTIIIK